MFYDNFNSTFDDTTRDFDFTVNSLHITLIQLKGYILQFDLNTRLRYATAKTIKYEYANLNYDKIYAKLTLTIACYLL